MLGKNFVDKCLQSEILTDPWAHTVTENHIDQDEFVNLRNQCAKLLDIKMSDMPTFKVQTENHIQPKQFKEFEIDWYDQILEISHNIYDNRKVLLKKGEFMYLIYVSVISIPFFMIFVMPIIKMLLGIY